MSFNDIVNYFNKGINSKNPIPENVDGLNFLMSYFENEKRFTLTVIKYEIYITSYVFITIIEKLENYFKYKGIKAIIKLKGQNLEIEGFL